MPTGAAFTEDDLTAYLEFPERILSKPEQGGKIPGQKAGWHWRFHRETIDAWLKRSNRKDKHAIQ